MNVRCYEKIENKGDLVSLVTSIVYRTRKPFRKEDIVALVVKYTKGSMFENQIELFGKHVEETLDIFQRNSIIACWNGTFYPRKPFSNYFIEEYYEAKRQTPSAS